jgi:putative MATE family efflux protein
MLIEAVGRALARMGWVDAGRAARVAELAWPRVVTGLARMSKTAADVAMVGAALGPAAIAGVGYALPYWGLAFAVGGGIAGGTISLVSRSTGAGDTAGVTRAVWTSAIITGLVIAPVALVCSLFAQPLIGLIGTGGDAIAFGAEYLRIAALAMPFGALNLIGSRALVGAGDARTPMAIRAGAAVGNVGLGALFIFVFDWGVTGAALGTLLANAAGTVAFAWGLSAGRLPGLGTLPVQLDLQALEWNRETASHLTEIGTPLALTNLVQSGGQFPLLAIVGLFGPDVVAAFVVALRMRDLMNTPGWGFGLASSSLVGQALGQRRDPEAVAFARDTLRHAVAVYALVAAIVFVFAGPISGLFVSDSALLPTTTALVRAACVAVVLWGVMNGALGPLRAGGDTRWPFYGRLLGLFAFALPAAYAGAVTPIGLAGLYGALLLENGVPAAVTYARYRAGQWRRIGRAYQPAQGT